MANRNRKRKRKRNIDEWHHASKKMRRVATDSSSTDLLKHPTLCLYYNRISTLRNHLIQALPASSKARRQKIASIGLKTLGRNSSVTKIDENLRTLLDTTLVCAVDDKSSQECSQGEKSAPFPQQANLTDGNSFEEGTSSMSEVG